MNPLAGALVLAVGMGFGRFSFTGMYPLMVHDGQLTVSGGSLAASANYLGYLIGALILSRVHHRHSTWLCQVAMSGTVWCLVALSLNPSLAPLLTVRLLAGNFSALAMVSASDSSGPPLLAAGGGLVIATLGCMVKRTAPRTETKSRAARTLSRAATNFIAPMKHAA